MGWDLKPRLKLELAKALAYQLETGCTNVSTLLRVAMAERLKERI